MQGSAAAHDHASWCGVRINTGLQGKDGHFRTLASLASNTFYLNLPIINFGNFKFQQATQQVAMNVLLHGMNAGDAVAAPRIHHQGIPETLRVEKIAPLDSTLQEALVARGHTIEPIHNVANVQAIVIDRSGERRLHAASDPRKGGRPAGR